MILPMPVLNTLEPLPDVELKDVPLDLILMPEPEGLLPPCSLVSGAVM